MTIHGQQYRPAPYQPTSRWQRLQPLIRLEFTTLFRHRWGVLAFIVCIMPSIGRLVMLLSWLGVLAFGGPRMRGNAPPQLQPDRIDFYVDAIVAPEQGMFVFLCLTALATARAVAKDRRTNALELYWTRGISPRGYFLGKWLGTFLLVSSMTVATPLLLWLTGVLLADDWSFLEQTRSFMPAALAGLLVFTAVLTTLCIQLSAIAATPNAATIVWCLLLGGSSALGHIIGHVTRRQGLTASVSVFDAAGALARALAGMPQRGVSVSVPGAAVLLAALLIVFGALARRRLRLQEAVA